MLDDILMESNVMKRLHKKLLAFVLGTTWLILPWPGCAHNVDDLLTGWGDGVNLIPNWTDENRWEAPHIIQWLLPILPL